MLALFGGDAMLLVNNLLNRPMFRLSQKICARNKNKLACLIIAQTIQSGFLSLGFGVKSDDGGFVQR